MNKISVVGIGFKPLEKKASDAVNQSDDVLVNSRLLEVFKGYSEYEGVKDRIIVHANVYETMDYIAGNYEKRKIALIAAGDPMFFGIGRLAVERFGRDSVEVFPDLSSVQVAFARVGETSNNALLISFHGGPDLSKRRKLEYDISELPGLVSRHNKIAILTDRVNSPEKIAGAIIEPSAFSFQRSAIQIFVCEKIGYEDERIVVGTPEEISAMTFQHPNVVIIKRTDVEAKDSSASSAGSYSSDVFFGLREAEIAHSRGLITKDEVRAVALHKLRLLNKGVLWDIGAGSGSVSLEASRLSPELKVYAIEKDESQVKNIHENKSRYSSMNIEIIQGEAPGVLKDLPAPDRVFIGGSGGNMTGIVKMAVKVMASGIIVINAVTLETLNEAVASIEAAGCTVDISEISVSRSKTVGTKRHMSALNPIFIVTGRKD